MHASFESYHCCAAVVFKICKSYIYASCVVSFALVGLFCASHISMHRVSVSL